SRTPSRKTSRSTNLLAGAASSNRVDYSSSERTSCPIQDTSSISRPSAIGAVGAGWLSDIETGLEALVREIRTLRIHSVAIPPLGSGLGGLDWSQVRPKIEKAMRALGDNVKVIIFEPKDSLREVISRQKCPT